MRYSGGHVSKFIVFAILLGVSSWDCRQVCLGLVIEIVTSRYQILIQLESLILAQNERWRQA